MQPRAIAIAISALVALHIALALLAFIPAPHPGGDNGVYLALGHSLLDGGYRDLFDPALPRHTQFPPGYPTIVAAALALGIGSWIGLKFIIIAFSAAAVALTVVWIARDGRPRLALGVAFLVAISPGVLELTHWELSDVPFWALTMGALVLLQRLPAASTRATAGAAVLVACAYFTRSAGLPLIVAAGAWLIWQRRWRQLATFAGIIALPMLAWSLWTRAHSGYATLILSANPYDPAASSIGIAGLPGRALENATLYATTFLPTLVGGGPDGFATVAALLLLLAAVAGWALRARSPRVAEFWVPIYVLMLFIWNPEWAGERLLLPLYPALLYYAGVAIIALERAALARARRIGAPATRARRAHTTTVVPTQAPRAGRSVAAPLAAAIFVLIALPGMISTAKDGTFCSREYLRGEALPCLRPEWRDFFALADHARGELPERAAVLVRKPALFWTVSNIPGRMYPLSADPATFFAAARAAGAEYVVLDALDEVAPAYLMPILIARSSAFCIVHSLGGNRATLLGILPGAELVADAVVEPGANVTVAFRPCGPEYRRGGTAGAPNPAGAPGGA